MTLEAIIWGLDGCIKIPVPHGPSAGSGEIKNLMLLSERPPEAEDRATPYHWEGDLIICR